MTRRADGFNQQVMIRRRYLARSALAGLLLFGATSGPAPAQPADPAMTPAPASPAPAIAAPAGAAAPAAMPASPAGSPLAEGTPGSSPALGAIELDRAAGRFIVPGRFLERDPNQNLLEYLAVKRGGTKAYEAILALDTTATGFNLACLLIGLDPARATLPEHHFDPRPVVGDPVEVMVEWEVEGKAVRVPPAALILVEGQPADDHEWVYTGSTFVPSGDYLAEMNGTLIGFVHDPDSIIEHRRGIGLGGPMMPTVNRALLPPPGTPIRVIVSNPAPRPAPGAR